MIKKRQAGFTLLEVLVVISIIGILIAMGSVAFTTAQQTSRDARRSGDLKAVQNAFEQYYAENSSSYAANCDTMAGTALPSGLPSDPKGTGSYVYSYNCTSTSEYCVCALLEKGDGNANSAAADCTGLGTPGGYFCLSNLQ